MTEESTPKFEQAFARLETILAHLNSGEVSLDESLKLYEEANRLILACHGRLSEAEQKVQLLMKHRDGTLSQGADGSPETQAFPYTPDS